MISSWQPTIGRPHSELHTTKIGQDVYQGNGVAHSPTVITTVGKAWGYNVVCSVPCVQALHHGRGDSVLIVWLHSDYAGGRRLQHATGCISKTTPLERLCI